jgi:hypothetical protein
MITTNAASASDPSTYTSLREECEKLLQIAKKLEDKARANRDAFSEDQEFLQMKKEFQSRYISVHSIGCCL